MTLAFVTTVLAPAMLLAGSLVSLPSLLERGVELLAPADSHGSAHGTLARSLAHSSAIAGSPAADWADRSVAPFGNDLAVSPAGGHRGREATGVDSVGVKTPHASATARGAAPPSSETGDAAGSSHPGGAGAAESPPRTEAPGLTVTVTRRADPQVPAAKVKATAGASAAGATSRVSAGVSAGGASASVEVALPTPLAASGAPALGASTSVTANAGPASVTTSATLTTGTAAAPAPVASPPAAANVAANVAATTTSAAVTAGTAAPTATVHVAAPGPVAAGLVSAASGG